MEDYKQVLLQEKTTLEEELKHIAVYNDETGDWVAKPDALVGEADPNMTADNTEDWNERRAMVGQLETRYHNVRIALEKFTGGSFGVCEICQEDVEPARLHANAAARTCMMHLEQERQLPF